MYIFYLQLWYKTREILNNISIYLNEKHSRSSTSVNGATFMSDNAYKKGGGFVLTRWGNHLNTPQCVSDGQEWGFYWKFKIWSIFYYSPRCILRSIRNSTDFITIHLYFEGIQHTRIRYCEAKHINQPWNFNSQLRFQNVKSRWSFDLSLHWNRNVIISNFHHGLHRNL